MLPEDRKVQFGDGKAVTMRTVEDVPPSIYVNNAIFDMTQWDINIDLSELRRAIPGENPDSPILLINPTVRLIMTVPYAKVFADALLRHIAKYEKIEKDQQNQPAENVPSPETESEAT